MAETRAERQAALLEAKRAAKAAEEAAQELEARSGDLIGDDEEEGEWVKVDHYEPPPEEVIVSDQKRLVVDSYARYRIVNPLLFFQTVGTEDGGDRMTSQAQTVGAGCLLPSIGDRATEVEAA